MSLVPLIGEVDESDTWTHTRHSLPESMYISNLPTKVLRGVKTLKLNTAVLGPFSGFPWTHWCPRHRRKWTSSTGLCLEREETWLPTSQKSRCWKCFGISTYRIYKKIFYIKTSKYLISFILNNWYLAGKGVSCSYKCTLHPQSWLRSLCQ